MSAAMRVWVAGQITLAADAVLAAAAGFAGRPLAGGELGERLLLAVGGVVLFFVPGELAVRFPALRTRWFWLAGSLPAVLWVPALPFVLLRTGPPLASPVGLALMAAGLIGSVIVVVGGSLAAVEARSSTRAA